MKGKIIQINECLSGSTGKIARQIGNLAVEAGFESWIAYSAFEPEFPCKSTLITIGSRADYYCHALQTRLLDNHGLASKIATKQLICEMKRISPDVVHLHNIHGYYLNYEILFSYLAESGIPVIWTLHDCWPFTGHCAYFSYVNCNKWKTGCHRCPIRKDYPKSYVDRSKRNWFQKKESFKSVGNLTLVPVSNWLGNIARNSFLGEKPIRVIHNGIDLSVFRPTDMITVIKNKYGLGEKKIILGVASVWDQRKGVIDFYKLAKKLSREQFIIAIVGKMTEQIPLQEDKDVQIIHISSTDNPMELASLYSAAEVFLNTTYEDNYPTVNLEAMACGTPVITYKTGGSPEGITSNTGYVVEQGDIDSVASIIQQLNKKDYSEQCRKQAESFFNGKVCFNPYIDLYRQLGGR